jgi:putative two-component system response regulator
MSNETPKMEPATIVVVDDDLVALGLMEEIISHIPGCSAITFSDPAEALGWCQASHPDVIVSDYQMPEMDGLQLLGHLRADASLGSVPIMMVTSVGDREVRHRALEMGATDFLSKPLDPAEVTARIRNMILVHQAQRDVSTRAQELSFQVSLATATLKEREREVIIRLSRAAEYRDWESSAHVMRVAHYCRIIARRRGLPEWEQDRLFLAAPMHDVGKIGIPDRILLKPGKLTPDEFAIMRQHTVIGQQILSDSTSELLQYAAVIARTHHERIDGAGYPDRIKGDHIPLGSRILTVADIFDAMTSRRPYQEPSTVDEAVTYIRAAAGTQLEAESVDAFLVGLPQILETRDRFRDEKVEAVGAGVGVGG